MGPLFPAGGLSFHREPLHLGRDVHRACELHWLDSGTLAIDLADGRRLHARGGDLMLTSAGTWHRGVNDIIPPSRLLWLQVDPAAPGAAKASGLKAEELRDLANALAAAGDTVISAPGLRGNYRRILGLLRDQDHAAELRTELVLLLFGVRRLLASSAAPATGAATRKALGWLRRNPTAPLRIASLAALCGLSPSRFHAVFLTETGETPASCQRRLRMARAGDLLHERPDSSIASIAEAVGFSDQRAFATAFRRCTGTTPTHWRSLVRLPGQAFDAPLIHGH
jgi:AraC-like DNA-binding protein